MFTIVSAFGMTLAVVLLAVLLATLRWPSLRLWPTPGPGTWQSYLFWPLFRGLNAFCVVSAAHGALAGHPPLLGLPSWVRLAGFVLLACSTALFIYSFRMLGRDNSYGAQDGLVTTGIYRWSRNPQNALLVAVYGCLAVAADFATTYVLCAAMMAVYALMVLAEEPWLQLAYGDAYRRYCGRVPRFFNWRRMRTWLHAAAGRRRRLPAR